MWQAIGFLLIISLIIAVLKWIGAALFAILVYVILPIVILTVAFYIIRAVYHFFNPDAKKTFLIRKAKEAEERRKQKEKEEAVIRANLAEARARAERTKAEARARAELSKAERRAKKEREEAEIRRKELEHRQHRDGDQQSTPYTYKIGQHGNESLAVRYGIANQERKVKEYWYYVKGGERKRNQDRDRVYYEPASSIRVQKTKKISKDFYEVKLTDYRSRKARAIIEVGTEYVKTFYPLADEWFEKHSDLEITLKGNGTFTLKELATFHIQKTVGT